MRRGRAVPGVRRGHNAPGNVRLFHEDDYRWRHCPYRRQPVRGLFGYFLRVLLSEVVGGRGSATV